VTIAEPSTLVSDYVLGTFAGVLAWRLFHRVRTSGERAPVLWAAAIAATSAASFAGGTYHGFHTATAPAVAGRVWTVVMLTIGAASFLLLASAVVASFDGRARRWWLTAAALKLVVYCVWVLRHDAFVFAIADYGSALLVVLWLAATGRLCGAAGWRSPVVGGVAVTIVAAALQQSGLDLHRHFNHNDLQHVVQIGAVWLLYRGGARLRDSPCGQASPKPIGTTTSNRDDLHAA
jgi:hypothetical protein